MLGVKKLWQKFKRTFVDICLSDWMVDLQEFAIDLRNYFKCCPICFSSAKGTFKVHLTSGGKDTLACNVCGAEWKLYILPFAGFQWAELDSTAKDGRGQELCGRRLDKKEILSITQNATHDQNNQPVVTKEIIKEKEVLTKIRCPYCRGSYNETLDKCPHCGSKN
jgi:DNA-directed RNA polymerase subunit RPC12/RpoP